MYIIQFINIVELKISSNLYIILSNMKYLYNSYYEIKILNNEQYIFEILKMKEIIYLYKVININ